MRRAILFIVPVLLLVFVSFVPELQDKVVFLDVGQGDSILFQRGTQQILIDGGQGMEVLERLGEELPWFDKRIDVIILTHPQRDHLEGLLHVLERYRVDFVLLPRASYDSLLYDTWLQKIIDAGVPYRFAWEGQQLVLDDLMVQILAPLDTSVAYAAVRTDVNNASVITRVDYRGLSFLLTGDAEERIERMLVAQVPGDTLDVDVLKAGHHGSNTSTTAELLDAAAPGSVVISVGADNRFRHPHPKVLERLQGIPTWRTDQNGSVRFNNDGERWWIATER